MKSEKNKKFDEGKGLVQAVSRRGFSVSVLGGAALVFARPLEKAEPPPVSVKEASYYQKDQGES